MTVEVIKAGALTTIQDVGRFGYQGSGVVVGGAMDSVACRVANILVGNEEYAAVLEITLSGLVLMFHQPALIAICGADLLPIVDGMPVPLWRPVMLKQGATLHFSGLAKGCRAYLAVSGGWKGDVIMGSRSTYLIAGIGGYEGRSLKQGDLLEVDGSMNVTHKKWESYSNLQHNGIFTYGRWGPGYEIIPSYAPNPTIRVIRGAEWEWFDDQSRAALYDSDFMISTQSNRMGYRLQGNPLKLAHPREMISEAVTIGTIQIPPDGQPILLMADRQTTGGYPRIAQVASIDIPLLAQVKPGDRIRYRQIDLEEAQWLYVQRERALQLFKAGMLLVK